MANATKSEILRAQYEAWPYPRVPLLAALPSTHPWELHVASLWDRCGSGPAPAKPRIWNAGCGTFQPYAFAVANPHAEIVATDLSRTSLAIAQRRCRWHGRRNVRFAPCDLADETTWPEGTFDLIECYGVLMNLADPLAVLRGLRARLAPGGVLRLMVYPQWSRSRIFQVQRLARLLGLTANDRRHPSALRTFVKRLPRAHPLRWAFTTYADSRNDAGVVDGFLHAGDRGFTGFELGALLRDAGLVPSYWFHRPWAQPDVMAERLELADRSQAFVLAYLDLWQELRGNFVVCARPADAPRVVQASSAHPAFSAGRHGLRHRLRLQRLSWLGGRLPWRTGEDAVVLRPRDVRALRAGRTPENLRDCGLVLGGRAHASPLPACSEFAAESTFRAEVAALRLDRRAPNPLYAHLFAAFELAARHPELGLPDLEAQIGRWLPWADPLEEAPVHFGLTPYGTFRRFRTNVLEHAARGPLPAANGYAGVRLRDDAKALQQVRSMLAACGELPQLARDDASLRELFVLLFTADRLFVPFEAP